MLSVEHWRQLEALFHRASALPREQRDAFAREAAGHDPPLLRELEKMLAVEAEATVRLRMPLQQAASTLQPPAVLPAGTRCGPWAVDGVIGSGGMGRVYLGHRADGAYNQQVAIKLIANPGLDARQHAFFEFECRMQAQMQHPAIAQIYDAGVHAGERPYLVMEYIAGETIERWCEQRRAPLARRVQLVMQVCQGVQHAHQKGVIHRDLKPSNVLVGEVDDHPQPKVIDFGIAIGGPAAAHEGGAGGTPGYMSPEQTGTEIDIDARSDVFSLGALLYELLCGQRPPALPGTGLSPLQALAALEPEQQLAVAQARRCTLAGLRRALEDGLDAIVRKATQPERARRYDAVSTLLADLDRWQHDLPPLAVASPPLLVARKFLQRHRLPVAAAAAVCGCLVAGLLASLWALSQARDQQQVAAHRQQQLERSVAFQQEMLQSVDIDAMGHAVAAAQGNPSEVQTTPPASDTARDLLERYVVAHALERLQHDFDDDPVLATDLRQSLARVLTAIGRYPAAISELRTVLASLRTLQQPPARVAAAMFGLADVLYRQGDFAQADATLAEAGALRQADSNDALWLRLDALKTRVLLAQGQPQQALTQQLALLQDWSTRLPAQDAALLDIELDTVETMIRLTRREDALVRLQALLPRLRAEYGRDAPRTLAATLLLADLLNTSNQYEASLTLAAEVRDQRERSLGADHPDTLQAKALEATNRVRLAQDPAAWVQAEAFVRDLVEHQRRVFGATHPETLRSTGDLIRILAKQDAPAKLEQAITMQRALLQLRTELLGPLHPDTLFTLGGLASMLARTDRYDEARRTARQTLDGLTATMPGDYWLIAGTWDVLGQAEDRAGNLAAARDAHAHALRFRADLRGVYDAHTTESAARLYEVLARMHDRAAMAQIQRTYLDPVIARDPLTLNASQRSVRDAAVRALQGADAVDDGGQLAARAGR